jgi:hypothetical protein
MNRWRHKALLVLFAASIAITVIFGMRAFHFRPHPAVDEPIRPWMSVPYVAHSYHVPPHVLFEKLGIPPQRPPDRRTIAEVARAQNRPVTDVISDLQDAIIRARTPFPPPPPPKELSPQPRP